MTEWVKSGIILILFCPETAEEKQFSLMLLFIRHVEGVWLYLHIQEYGWRLCRRMRRLVICARVGIKISRYHLADKCPSPDKIIYEDALVLSAAYDSRVTPYEQ